MNIEMLMTQQQEDEWDRQREDEQIKRGKYRKGWSE